MSGSEQVTNNLSNPSRFARSLLDVLNEGYLATDPVKAVKRGLSLVRSQKELASYLDIHDAHISNANLGGYVSKKLKAALIATGCIPPPEPSKYLLIRKDSPESAARSIVRTCGTDYAEEIVEEILLLLEE